MGIVDRVKEDFYQCIIREHVVLLCGMDVDSLCACKALQALFMADDVGHTVIPVAGKEDMRSAYNEHADQVKSMVLINCGGSTNLVELLEPEGSVQLFIIDSQRPLNLDNVYNQDQIHVVVREDDQLEVPEFDAIYSSDLEDDFDEEYFSDEDSAPKSKKRREEDSYETKRKRHLWRRKREELLFKYYELNYHETSASLVVYELACKLNRDCNELLWLAITGLTEQLLHEKIDRERYVTDRDKLQENVMRHNRSDDDAPPTAINSMRITFENELRLVLYRHWTLYESLCHSEYTVCRFKIWTMKGKKKLKEFLAYMGLPLVQCEQKFLSMDEKYRENLGEMMRRSAQKFQLDDDVTYGSYVAKFGYRTVLCASDMVFASAALMENADKPFSECFSTALEALSRPDLQLKDGIKQALQQQTAIVDQVRHFIETRQVVCTGPFIYADVEEGTQYVKYFSKPMTLCKLARFLRESWSVTNRKACDLPFIVSAPLDSASGVCLVVGVPPHSEDTRRSEFSKAFEQAASKLQGHASFNHFDGSVIQIRKEDRSRFFDALIEVSAL